MQYELLDRIREPADLRGLSEAELTRLAGEIRSFLIENVSETGGHLASNLGVVELTLALHRVFDSPRDKLVFDVGHQSYVHKLLTGRRTAFRTLRSFGGLSGFTRREESAHDPFGAGHSSTSVSAALGLMKAMKLAGEPGWAVAVIGDGALTGGMAYEALNNAGRDGGRLIIVLNENELSISPNVGAITGVLSKLRSRQSYFRLKDFVRDIGSLPLAGRFFYRIVHRLKRALKAVLVGGSFFEDMGFEYLGPVDGHDIEAVSRLLRRAKALSRPTVVHVRTVKGKGYPFAEQSPVKYHGVSRFDVRTGEAVSGSTDCFSERFGEELLRMAGRDARICAITAAMAPGTGLMEFGRRYPDRFFDVGIAEQHAVTFAAGLSAGGMIPVMAVYSTFLQRAYDQVLHDVALQNLRVVLAVDRAGLVGEDGATHHGVFDVAYLSHIPGLSIFSPATYEELALSLREAASLPGPSAVRYPRGEEDPALRVLSGPPDGLAHTGPENARVRFITYGCVASEVLLAARMLTEQGIPVEVVKLCRIKPLPEKALLTAVGGGALTVFVEEGIQRGGVGEQLGAFLLERGVRCDYRIYAMADRFIPHGSRPLLLEAAGLSAKRLCERVTEELDTNLPLKQ